MISYYLLIYKQIKNACYKQIKIEYLINLFKNIRIKALLA